MYQIPGRKTKRKNIFILINIPRYSVPFVLRNDKESDRIEMNI